MTIDQLCAEALARCKFLTESRILEFRRQCERDAETTRRSFAQKWRHLGEQLRRKA